MEKFKDFLENLNFGEALIESAGQALEHSKGNKNRCRVTVRELNVMEYKPHDDLYRYKESRKISIRGKTKGKTQIVKIVKGNIKLKEE